MAGNSDDPKGPSRPGDTPSAKRPYTTIELKATEIGAPEGGAAKASDPKSTGKPEQKPDPKPDPKSAAKDEGTAAPKPASPGPSGPSATSKSAASPSMTTPLVAGLTGAAVALLIGYAVLPQLGFFDDDAAPSSRTADTGIARRLAAVEQELKQRGSQAPSDLAAKLGEAEARIARLEQEAQAIAPLREAQTKTADATKMLESKIGQQAASPAEERLEKLETSLATLAAAAKSDPDKTGRIPQLAALVGRIADLESAVNARTQALRTDVIQEVEKRLAANAAVAETARSGVQRLDRDVAGARTEGARLAERFDALKAASDRTEQATRALNAETDSLKSSLAALRDGTPAQVKSEVTAVLKPLADKVAALEGDLQRVVRSEKERTANAERIVLALELGNLKRALDRGQPYGPELDAVKKAGGAALDTTVLDRYRAEGLPTPAELAKSFHRVADAIVDADSEPVDGSLMDRLLANAKSIVRVRKISHRPEDTGTEAVVARMETAIKDGRLADVLAEDKKLSAKGQDAAEDWIKKVEARAAVDKAITDIEAGLKLALGKSGTDGNGAK
ncbi:MAG: hypothetical protein AB7K67_01850 [Hyphomicrobiaceae bacterium]